MDEYIDKQVALRHWPPCDEPADAYQYIKNFPAADVVSRGAYDQTDWERCVAMTQLKEIGKGLGERMDDVRPVVHGKWILKDNGEVVCSECNDLIAVVGNTEDLETILSGFNFCPNCGADMREER